MAARVRRMYEVTGKLRASFTEHSTYAQRSATVGLRLEPYNSGLALPRRATSPSLTAEPTGIGPPARCSSDRHATLRVSHGAPGPASDDAPAPKPCIVRVLDCSVTLPLDVMLTKKRVNSKPVRLSPAGSLQYALRFVPYEPVSVACAGRTSDTNANCPLPLRPPHLGVWFTAYVFLSLRPTSHVLPHMLTHCSATR